jgi:DNA-binding cell septation regulator SpoVG
MIKNMFFLCCTVFLLHTVPAVPSLAGELSVTKIAVSGNKANVIINNVIAINDIEVKNNKLILPRYKSKSGKIFPQARFLSKEAEDVVLESILSGTPSEENIKRINYKITKLSPYRSANSKMKAFAAVTFNGVLEVECKVMRSRKKGELYISWPTRPPDREKGENRWMSQVELINDKVKSIVEKDLIKTFKNMGPGGVILTNAEVTVENKQIEAPVTVTDVKVKKLEGGGELESIAEVELNSSFRIYDINVYNRNGQIYLEYPVYISSSGRRYDQMRIFSTKLRKEIKKAIETGKPSEEKGDKLGFVITKFEEFNRKNSSMKYFLQKMMKRVNMWIKSYPAMRQ